ncbi:MAG: S-methyl-5-thioribose-1-phosphate isomerase [Bacillota bacterium]
MKYKTLEFKEETLKLIDQRKLPGEIEYFKADNYKKVIEAIKNMVVRGAPAIGAAGAFGVYLAASEFKKINDKNKFYKKIKSANKDLIKARPTAVNLSWAVNRMENRIKENRDKTVNKILNILLNEARKILKEDIEINKQMAQNGNKLIPEQATILTHCNTGALATVDYGTALGVIREAYFDNKNIEVFADETRPRLQGARLTTFELKQENIPVTLIVDSVAATLIKDGKIDIILVGADRIAANGDTANKIGTYMLSEIARKHQVPFYVVAPTSTIDIKINTGEEIEIEERGKNEVIEINGQRIAPSGVKVYNPAFDITPISNINAIITEKGIIRAPFKENIKKYCKNK